MSIKNPTLHERSVAAAKRFKAAVYGKEDPRDYEDVHASWGYQYGYRAGYLASLAELRKAARRVTNKTKPPSSK